jgi:hypothetical protein
MGQAFRYARSILIGPSIERPLPRLGGHPW